MSNTAVLKAGTAAKEFAGNFLSKPFRVITSRRVAPGASRTDRYYAVIERGETRLDAALLEEGLARATSEVAAYPDDASGKRAMQQLRVLEQNSEKAKRGIWAASGTRVEAIVNAVKSRLGKAIDHRTNVNTATATELASLPGVGPKMAAQIIRARPLKDLSALDALPGFGPKKIEALRELVSF